MTSTVISRHGGAFAPSFQVAILDDDPTGAQDVMETSVLLDWSRDVLERLPDRSFHIVTNTRAGSAADAYAITREVVTEIRRRLPQAHFVLRGDSTLRAHLWEEYEAVREIVYPDGSPLLLVPALPAAGRVTVDGIHLLEQDGLRRPLHETEYATDGGFSYRTSRLLDWAEERSYGLLEAASGVDLPLATLRAGGADTVQETLVTAASRGVACVVVPDAETLSDLRAIADGLRAAWRDGVPVIVRCAPTFAALLAGTRASGLVAAPSAGRLLVVCGSYVPQTTRQLEHLLERYPGSLVELSLTRLLTGEGQSEIVWAVSRARSLLRSGRLAVVTTPRTRSAAADDPTAAGVISASLARLTKLLANETELILFKGGITSAVGVRDGLGGRIAVVEGPVRPGIALWRLEDGRRCLVFPGNVGDNDDLAVLVEGVLSSC